jgi:hypothetical protein
MCGIVEITAKKLHLDNRGDVCGILILLLISKCYFPIQNVG